MLLKPLVTISALSFMVAIALPAHAHSTCDRLNNPIERSYCKEQASLADARPASDRSARYRYLAEAVSQVVYDYYKQTGQVFPVTDETISEVMRVVGASRSETRFVVEQLVVNVQAIAALPPLQSL